MTRRVLVVCVGNICRSPMAEALLRHHWNRDTGITFESAGLAAMAGSPMDPLAESVLAAHGLTARPHVARQLRPSLLEAAEVVLAMDGRQKAALFALAPRIRSRLFLLGKWQGNVEIPDPYRKERSLFEHTYQLIDAAARSWCERL